MGDVGSMAIGGMIAAMAILTRTEILLAVIAGVYVLASGSVILQRAYFKLTRGKRLFLMSPIHHHLEMRGWAEITIVVRMWIIAGLLALTGVGLFYVEWLVQT
jgi:phospho-N-acetylmuramoyl-pentapeptide-transferase